MTIEFKAVTLDSGEHDNDAVLVFREGRLMAVLTCLSEIHGSRCGHWFVEATFNGDSPGITFDDLESAETWASG